MSTSSLGRRNYLRAVGGMITTAGVAGTTVTASTADYVTISGKLISHDGDPIAGRKVYVTATGYNETDSSGYFQEEVESGEHVSLGLYKSQGGQLHAPVKNGVPHIFRLASLGYVSSDEELGTIRIPKAYSVNLRALDSDGDPASNAEFGFGAEGFGSGSGLTANNDGYCVISSANFTGIELTESATVSINIPSGDAMIKYKESLNVDGPLTVIAQEEEGTTITEGNPDESTKTTTTTSAPTSTPATRATPTTTETTTTGTTVSTTPQSTPQTTVEMSTNETETHSKRGFFSNGETAGDYEFLTNPFYLTVGGFVLSVAGIAQNMIRGK